MNTDEKLVPAPPNSPEVDTPMDEFEYTKKGIKPPNVNSLKLVKLGGIAVVLLFVVLGGLLFATRFLMPQSGGPTPIAQNSGQPSATPSPTPVVNYPPEYAQIEKSVGLYDQAITDFPEMRNELAAPALNLNVTF